MDPFGSFVWFQVMFVLVFIVVVFVIVARVFSMSRGEGKSEVREREVIREVVKVRCRYCGQLYEERLDRCPNCGGKNA